MYCFPSFREAKYPCHPAAFKSIYAHNIKYTRPLEHALFGLPIDSNQLQLLHK